MGYDVCRTKTVQERMQSQIDTSNRQIADLSNELAATKQQLLAEQLHIKELRDYVEHNPSCAKFDFGGALGVYETATCTCGLDALAKQPDTRALDKALLEAELTVLSHAYDCCKPYGVEFSHMLTERTDKLAELNKE